MYAMRMPSHPRRSYSSHGPGSRSSFLGRRSFPPPRVLEHSSSQSQTREVKPSHTGVVHHGLLNAEDAGVKGCERIQGGAWSQFSSVRSTRDREWGKEIYGIPIQTWNPRGFSTRSGSEEREGCLTIILIWDTSAMRPPRWGKHAVERVKG